MRRGDSLAGDARAAIVLGTNEVFRFHRHRVYPRDGDDIETAQNADVAMYREGARCGHFFYHDSMREASARLSLEHVLQGSKASSSRRTTSRRSKYSGEIVGRADAGSSDARNARTALYRRREAGQIMAIWNGSLWRR
jgi:hypothetical protein